ncbi:hypothetical protein [Rhodopirellula islandica]|uniref:hypothetical protein n=1 Tax=Rhodopirellula islandica TaxID=595434 RepID=UPI00123779FF|nr:hypothetical protein [Rhodopirellula islandica]
MLQILFSEFSGPDQRSILPIEPLSGRRRKTEDIVQFAFGWRGISWKEIECLLNLVSARPQRLSNPLVDVNAPLGKFDCEGDLNGYDIASIDNGWDRQLDAQLIWIGKWDFDSRNFHRFRYRWTLVHRPDLWFFMAGMKLSAKDNRLSLPVVLDRRDVPGSRKPFEPQQRQSGRGQRNFVFLHPVCKHLIVALQHFVLLHRIPSEFVCFRSGLTSLIGLVAGVARNSACDKEANHCGDPTDTSGSPSSYCRSVECWFVSWVH